MTKVSMSIVNYNNFNEISKLLNTLCFQSFDRNNLEVYIIDNSDDEELFKTIMSNSINYIYFKTGENLGYGRGHNYVLNHLKSDYHIISNPDILIDTGTISELVKYMENNIEVGMVIPKILLDDGEILHAYRQELTISDMFIRYFTPKSLFKNRRDKQELQDKDYSSPFRVPFAQGSFLMIRTELFKEMNGFDRRFFMYMEDADLCKRLNENSKIMYVPYTQVIHKWERGSHKNKNLFKIHLQSMIKYFRKWGWKIF